jgi:hypothetical protein
MHDKPRPRTVAATLSHGQHWSDGRLCAHKNDQLTSRVQRGLRIVEAIGHDLRHGPHLEALQHLVVRQIVHVFEVRVAEGLEREFLFRDVRYMARE